MHFPRNDSHSFSHPFFTNIYKLQNTISVLTNININNSNSAILCTLITTSVLIPYFIHISLWMVKGNLGVDCNNEVVHCLVHTQLHMIFWSVIYTQGLFLDHCQSLESEVESKHSDENNAGVCVCACVCAGTHATCGHNVTNRFGIKTLEWTDGRISQ